MYPETCRLSRRVSCIRMTRGFEPTGVGLTPLNNSYVLNTQILDSQDKKTILDIYNKLKFHETTDLISELNSIFSPYVLSVVV